MPRRDLGAEVNRAGSLLALAQWEEFRKRNGIRGFEQTKIKKRLRNRRFRKIYTKKLTVSGTKRFFYHIKRRRIIFIKTSKSAHS